MKKSLLKAILSQDMNIFKYGKNRNKKKYKRILFPLFLIITLMFTIGVYAYEIASELNKLNITYMTITIFSMLICLITALKGIYKTQGILFDSKDNDLLFSLPIPKKDIFLVRTVKLLLFNIIYNFIFLFPVFIVYIGYERPNFIFYPITVLYIFLVPIIPTIISSMLGYLIKLFSSKFKAKRLTQTVFTILLMIIIYLVSFNIDDFINDIATKATSINDMITKIYYPIGTYINLIRNFDILMFIKFLFINIIPFIIFVYLGSIYYFKIIARFNEKGINIIKNKNINVKVKSQLRSLIKKEFSRFISSPVYMINGSFGVVMMVLATIGICTKNDMMGSLSIIFKSSNSIKYIPYLFCQLIVFIGCLTCITCSSISLEGKSFNITKSLPVKTKTILLSKILMSNMISIPFILISDLIFIFNFNIDIIEILLIVSFTFIVPTFSALLGLLINLKYPKMNASNDAEVVKQSISTMISVFAGMTISAVSTFVIFYFGDYLKISVVIELLLFIFALIITYKVLNKYGEKRFREINV